MGYREHPVPRALAPYVECSWTVEPTRGAPHRVLPDGRIDVVRLPDGSTRVAGPATRPLMAPPVVGLVRGWRLRPAAAAGILGMPAEELRDLDLPAEAILGAGGLRARLLGGPPVDRLVGAAVAVLEADARMGVAELARRVGLSERQLRRRFLVAVGFGPKRLARTIRLQRLLVLAGTRPAPVGAALALAAGYADQPHMINEVRALAGVPPGELLAERVRFLQDTDAGAGQTG